MILRAVSLILLVIFAAPLLALSQSEPVSDQRFRDEFRFAVAVISKQSGAVCGGVLIAPRWVLTAAHCAGGQRYVLVDSAMRDVARKVEVTRRIFHPDYDHRAGQYDVALLYLAEGQDIEPAELASSIETLVLVRNDARARLVGWGRSGDGRGVANRLRVAEAKLNNLARGRSVFAYQDYVGPCGSDSGSPMLMQTLDGRWLVVGVARAADGMCSGRKGAAQYTDVGKVEAFIAANLAESTVADSTASE